MTQAPEVHAARHTPRLFIVLGVAAFLIGIATPAGLLIWQTTAPSVVLREGAAGWLIATHVDRSLIPTRTLTRVDTSTGSVVVEGPFSGIRGSPLVVGQFNKLPGLRLCTAEPDAACAPLAGVWAGTLEPTSAGRHALDFARDGMTTRNLAGLIILGALVLGVVIFASVLQLSDCDDDNDEDDCIGAERPP